MKKIYKHTLEFSSLNGNPEMVKLPRYAQVVSTAIQHGKIAVWFEVEVEQPEIEYFLASVGTGISLEDVGVLAGTHIGSILTHDGSIVHHIYFYHKTF